MSHRPSTVRWLAIGGFVVILGLAALLRLSYLHKLYLHPDEVIVFRVVQYMDQTGDWDTNWKKADLPDIFKYDQYNFSSYLYAVFLFGKLVGSREVWIYRLFSALCSVLVVAVLALLARRARPTPVVLCAALLTAIAPILVQDAHYARPEAFASLLTMLVVYLSWPWEPPRVWRSMVASILVGVLCACKVSMVFFVWMPLVPLAQAWRREPARRWALAAAAGGVVLLTALGFAATAPGAVVNPRAWLNGLSVLARQYSGIHPGHSHLGGRPVADLYLAYLGTTLGWTTMALFALGGLWELKRRGWSLLLFVYFPTLVFLAYFSSKSVFFERNLSHVIPLYLFGAACGMQAVVEYARPRLGRRLTPVLAALMVAAVVLAPADCSRRLLWKVFSRREEQRRNDYFARLTARAPYPALNLAPVDLRTEEVDEAIRAGRVPVLVRVWDPGGDVSERSMREFLQRYDAVEAGCFPSTFRRVPPCTLRTYGSWTDRFYLVSGLRPAK